MKQERGDNHMLEPMSNRKSDISTYIQASAEKQWTPLKSARRPIFGYNIKTKEYPQIIKNKETKQNEQQMHSVEKCNEQEYLKQIILHSCPCEGKAQICKILQDKLLKRINMSQMRRQYKMVSQTRAPNIIYEQIIESNPYYLYSSFRHALPSQYSRAEIAHLNNLMLTLDIDSVSTPQFQCLSSIHAHAKQQPITYYLYYDMKDYFPAFVVFEQMFQICLKQSGFSQFKVRQFYKDEGHVIDYEYFIQDFYQSFGANIIPTCYYAQFIHKLYERGIKPLVNLLRILVTQHYEKMLHHFRFIRMENYHKSRLHMLMLNWAQIIHNISQNQ